MQTEAKPSFLRNIYAASDAHLAIAAYYLVIHSVSNNPDYLTSAVSNSLNTLNQQSTRFIKDLPERVRESISDPALQEKYDQTEKILHEKKLLSICGLFGNLNRYNPEMVQDVLRVKTIDGVAKFSIDTGALEKWQSDPKTAKAAEKVKYLTEHRVGVRNAAKFRKFELISSSNSVDLTERLVQEIHARNKIHDEIRHTTVVGRLARKYGLLGNVAFELARTEYEIKKKATSFLNRLFPRISSEAQTA